MNELFNKYSGQIRCSDAEIGKEFSKIYEHHEYIEDWLNALTARLDVKDDEAAGKLRCQGNKLYANKHFKESFRLYTKAMCKATNEGKELGVILANRSALLYMIGFFEDCLKDIEHSLKCACSDEVKAKLYVRRLKCYSKTNLRHKMKVLRDEALDFLEHSHLTDKDAKRSEILLLDQANNESPGRQVVKQELPLLTGGCNPNFLDASSAVLLSYDRIRGRHVIANKDIEPDDVLFIEKPFIFAPVFVNENVEMSLTKCYNCLKAVYCSIPCDFCTKTIYCDERCKEECWEEFHRWECFGMQCNLWYHIGIGFPAFRAVIKGTPTGLCALRDSCEDDTVRFGQTGNNYLYFNKLLSNLSNMENILPHIISAGVIVFYLEKHTKFFKWISEQQAYAVYGKFDLIELIGGTITKHIAQLQCNSSVIDHVADQALLDDGGSVACAIYPSISMMNHSCSSNIKICYTREVAVVRASENIGKGEEVFNCYGIDYRYSDRQTRQGQCRQYYYFECSCRICKSSEFELV